MSNNSNLPTPDECFLSVLFDQWLKDSHCLDTKEAWDANTEKPFAYNEILDFMAQQGLSDGHSLGFVMVPEALKHISAISQTAGLCSCCVVQAVGQLSLEGSGQASFAKEHILDSGLGDAEAEVFLRSVSLYLNVIGGKWPFEYIGSNEATDADEAS